MVANWFLHLIKKKVMLNNRQRNRRECDYQTPKQIMIDSKNLYKKWSIEKCLVKKVIKCMEYY